MCIVKGAAHRVAPQVARPWLYDTLKLFNGYLLRCVSA
jgi:hypothetical protein